MSTYADPTFDEVAETLAPTIHREDVVLDAPEVVVDGWERSPRARRERDELRSMILDLEDRLRGNVSPTYYIDDAGQPVFDLAESVELPDEDAPGYNEGFKLGARYTGHQADATELFGYVVDYDDAEMTSEASQADGAAFAALRELQQRLDNLDAEVHGEAAPHVEVEEWTPCPHDHTEYERPDRERGPAGFLTWHEERAPGRHGPTRSRSRRDRNRDHRRQMSRRAFAERMRRPRRQPQLRPWSERRARYVAQLQELRRWRDHLQFIGIQCWLDGDGSHESLVEPARLMRLEVERIERHIAYMDSATERYPEATPAQRATILAGVRTRTAA